MSNRKAEWTGVFVFPWGEGTEILDCRLFSAATRRAAPLAIKMVHVEKDCHSTVASKHEPSLEQPKEQELEEPTPAAEVREQLFCPKCQRALRSDEVGRAIETPRGLIEVTQEELDAALKFEEQKRVPIEFVQTDPTFDAIGVDRRLLVCPKPAALIPYTRLVTLLHSSGLMGFVPTIVFNRRPRVGVVRPLVYPKVIFEEERTALVLDLLRDTGTLIDPVAIPDFPRELSPIPPETVSEPICVAQKTATPLDPDRCVDPRRRRLAELARRTLQASLSR